jgi:ABC-type transporter Mla MlaB component
MNERLLVLDQPVTMVTVTAIIRQIEFILEKSKVYIDFSKVGNVDSAAVALLIFIIQLARRHPQKIRWGNLPQNLLQCADIYELEEYFISFGNNVLPSNNVT